MKYYQDITLIPDMEVSIGFLWHKVFLQIHIGLADNKQPDGTSVIAVSFPEYKKTGFPLGSQLRLFAESEPQLVQFNVEKWLERLQDYCHIKPIRQVPDVKKFVRFQRKAIKSPERKAHRLAEHLQKPVAEIVKYRKQNDLFNECKLPFINMESQAPTETGDKNKFRLFIEQTFHDEAAQGSFDCYGLTKTATIPWF